MKTTSVHFYTVCRVATNNSSGIYRANKGLSYYVVNLNLLISFPSLEFFTTHIAVLTISVKSAIRGKLISAWQSPQGCNQRRRRNVLRGGKQGPRCAAWSICAAHIKRHESASLHQFTLKSSS